MWPSMIMRKRWKPNARQELAKKLATEYRLPRAERYDMVSRSFDKKVEVMNITIPTIRVLVAPAPTKAKTISNVDMGAAKIS